MGKEGIGTRYEVTLASGVHRGYLRHSRSMNSGHLRLLPICGTILLGRIDCYPIMASRALISSYVEILLHPLSLPHYAAERPLSLKNLLSPAMRRMSSAIVLWRGLAFILV